MTYARRIAFLTCASLATATLGITACGTTTPTAPASSTAAPTSTATSAPSGPTPTPTQTIRISYADGTVTGDTGRVHVALGSTVALVVTSSVADEVHLHGYDKKVDVPANGTTTLTFTATIPGVFEVELEKLSKTLVMLEVS